MKGRDIDEKETVIELTSGLWSVKGDAAEVRMTNERQAILDALAGSDEAMTPQEIADAAEISYANARQILSRMCKAGDIQKAGRGRYKCHNVTSFENGGKIRGIRFQECDIVTM